MEARELAIALSPYHFTSRELVGVAALQLADRVVTILPGGSSRDATEQAASSVGAYRRLVEAWSWAEPLLASGAVSPAWEGADPMGDVRAVCERIEEEPAWSALRPLMRSALFDSLDETLRAVATDLLKGGPDPGLLIPISAAIDRFAARHAICVARSDRSSVAQRAERRLGTRLASFSLPLLSQAEAERLVEARERLGPALASIRNELARLGEGVAIEGPEAFDAEDRARLETGAAAYTQAFRALEGELSRCDDVYDLHVRTSTVSVAIEALPADAVLRSSVEATGALGRPSRRRARVPVAVPEASSALVPVERGEGRWVLSLTMRAIGTRRS